MKKLLLLSFLLVGCETNNTFIDLSWLFNTQECTEEQCADQCEDVNGYLTDLADQIDVNTVKLNHYINEIKVNENYAELITVDGKVSTKNHIDLPPYIGEPMKHTLIIEFTQVN